MDILPFLLLPLAGPEELTEDENEGKCNTYGPGGGSLFLVPLTCTNMSFMKESPDENLSYTLATKCSFMASHQNRIHPLIMLMFSGLPVDLQYLPEDKKREEDPDIRKMVLETLLLVKILSAYRVK